MNRTLRIAVAAASLTMLGIAVPAAAQTDPHQHEQAAQPGRSSQGMGGMGMGSGMMGMMQGCPMMQGGGQGGHAMPRLPAGNEKLELQMHAEMMRAMSDILTKYAARLPDRK
jgi:hypothetical protein